MIGTHVVSPLREACTLQVLWRVRKLAKPSDKPVTYIAPVTPNLAYRL